LGICFFHTHTQTQTQTHFLLIFAFVKKKKKIAIVGSGPSALMLACMLQQEVFDVTLYERQAAPARKFLVAGDGGLNLTHSEEVETLLTRYSPASFLVESLRFFSNQVLREWLQGIGIETYIGSSKRIYPLKGIKPIQVLQAILKELALKNVAIQTGFFWEGWDEKGGLLFRDKQEEVVVSADTVVFALGGASWERTGSDGAWADRFREKGISLVPFQPSNCVFQIAWEPTFLQKAEGKWLKNISLRCGETVKMGELVITQLGVEGGAVYALSGEIRKQLAESGRATLLIDMKPSLSMEEVERKLSKTGQGSISVRLKEELKLSEVQIALLKSILAKEEYVQGSLLAQRIKQLPLSIIGMGPIEEAISTVGGVSLDEVSNDFQLKKMPHHYAIGEMLDWDAPTGGYLLQACFSMGAYLAYILNKME
jgi:uncharacterized flavoprotein (TIGR03862 family)